MNNFEFINPARIIFGNKPYGRIESLLKEMNVHSLMMIHTNSAVRLGIYDEIKEFLQNHPISELLQIIADAIGE